MTNLERFWSKTIKVDCGCIIWIGSTASNGSGKLYGHFWCDGKINIAHRWIYKQIKGPIQDGLELCHRCPCCKGAMTLCINIDHIELDTHKGNMQDAVIHNTLARQSGESNPASKLKNEDIKEIIRLYSFGISQRKIGVIYDVSHTMIRQIVNRKKWQTVVGEEEITALANKKEPRYHTHCINGHEVNEINTRFYKNRFGYQARACRLCDNERSKNKYRTNKERK